MPVKKNFKNVTLKIIKKMKNKKALINCMSMLNQKNKVCRDS